VIERTAWFHHGMTTEQRQAAIEADVDRHWPLVARDAAKRLIDRVAQDARTDCLPLSGQDA
jgi:hypothetical protein